MILERFKTFELREYQENLYHILDLEKLRYVLKNNEIKSYKFSKISLTRDVTMNYYTGDSPLSLFKLVLDGKKLRSKYKIKPFSYKSATGIRFDESEEQVQSEIIKPVFPYINKIVLIQKKIDALLDHFGEPSNYATSIGTRSGNIRNIISEVKELVESKGFELYVQKGTQIVKDDVYIESLLNYPIKFVDEKYSTLHRGHIKHDRVFGGFRDILVDLDGNVIKDFYVGMTFPKDFKVFKYEDLPKLEKFVKDGEKFEPYILTLNRMDDGSWKLVDMEPSRAHSLTESIKLDKQTILDYIPYADSSNCLYPGHNDEYDNCFFDSKEKAFQYVEEVKELFESLPDPIPIYRSIKVKNKEDIDTEYLGESWSFDIDSAIRFGMRNGSNYLLSAKIKKEYVNWAGTIKAYAIFSGMYSEEDENEIVVDEQTKIFDLKIQNIKGAKMTESFVPKRVEGRLEKFVKENPNKALIEAGEEENANMLKMAIKYGAITYSLLAMKVAIENGLINELKQMVKNGANLKSPSLLWYACNVNNTEIVKFLIENGNIDHKKDMSHIRCAIHYKNVELIKYLLDNGSKVEGNNSTILEFALSEDSIKIVNLLLNYNLMIDEKMINKYASHKMMQFLEKRGIIKLYSGGFRFTMNEIW